MDGEEVVTAASAASDNGIIVKTSVAARTTCWHRAPVGSARCARALVARVIAHSLRRALAAGCRCCRRRVGRLIIAQRTARASCSVLRHIGWRCGIAARMRRIRWFLCARAHVHISVALHNSAFLCRISASPRHRLSCAALPRCSVPFLVRCVCSRLRYLAGFASRFMPLSAVQRRNLFSRAQAQTWYLRK